MIWHTEMIQRKTEKLELELQTLLQHASSILSNLPWAERQ